MSLVFKEETIHSIMEDGNFLAANNWMDKEVVLVEPDKRSVLMVLDGVFFCLIASEIVKECLFLAAVGGVLLLLGAVRLKKTSAWFRPVGVLAVPQILWRGFLTVCSYFPAFASGLEFGWIDYCFKAAGFLLLIFLHIALLDAGKKGGWQAVCVKLPALEIGYAVLVGLGFIAGTAVFAVKVLIGILLAWYLHRIYRTAS